MTGPAGGGKTTTIRVVAKEMGIELVEWGEGIEEWSLGGGIGQCTALLPSETHDRPRIAHQQAVIFSFTARISASHPVNARLDLDTSSSTESVVDDFSAEPDTSAYT